MPGRTGADRRLGTRLVRGSWREVHAAGVRRRRYQPVDAAAVRCLGIGVRLLPRDTRLSGGSRQAGCLLQRQTRHFPSERQGGPRRGPHHAVWPRTVGTEHRHHLCEQPAGEGPDRARVRHIAGSAGEGIASSGHLDDYGGKRVAARFHQRIQRPFWRRNGRSRSTSPCTTTG